MDNEKGKRRNVQVLRIVALLEGISFLVLIGICMPLKYWYDMPQPNKIVGMGHGVLFMAYIIMVFWVKGEQGWNWKTTGWALLASVLPFGTFVADKKIFKPCL